MIRTDWHPPPATANPASSPVAVVILDRPEKKNALTPAMLEALRVELKRAGDRAGAIALTGAGAVFCSGFDLSLCRDSSAALTELLTGLSKVIRLMRDLPVPIVAAAHGAAIAGGCAILAGADLVVTHAECKLGYPVVRLGISPAVNAPFLLDAIGHGRTREWLLGGQILRGEGAFRVGLAHELAPTPERAVELAVSIAVELSAKPAAGLTATKRWLNELSAASASADRSLRTSLGLVGGVEERSRLSALWC
ncbi:MAG: enoyl-CoA hydratase/isomerase family protein [Phycisphaerales bacterium]